MSDTPEGFEGESQEYIEWVQAGEPEPTAAERVDFGSCIYEGCSNDAEFFVEWERQTGHLCCGPCATGNRLYVVENGLLEIPLTVDMHEVLDKKDNRES